MQKAVETTVHDCEPSSEGSDFAAFLLEDRMIAYHNDPAIKEKYLTRVREHREADQLIQGYGYWKDGKGCAVGCTLHSGNHAAYETELGIPRLLARLEDGIFEGLPVDAARLWPERFLTAVKVGSDLSLVGSHFFVWMMVDPTDGVIKFARTDRAKESIQRVADLYIRKIAGEDIPEKEWLSAAYAAYAAAAYAAYAAAAYARLQARVKQADKLIELLEAA